MTLKVLQFGATGQMARELIARGPRRGVSLTALSRKQADLTDPAAIARIVEQADADLVINAAAYTAVDKAETERDVAFLVNAESPAAMARVCAARGLPLVNVSTDYVFNGSGSRAWREDDATAPLGVYGRSKLAGEQALRASGASQLILRTAWVYAARGHNFLRTMLRLAGEREELRVVADQIGTPTPAGLIADVTAQALRHPGGLSGTWHLTASGQTSWHGFAEAIFAEAQAAGVLAKTPVVDAIASSDYPTPARRPAWSVLDNRRLQQDFGIVLPAWQDGLKRVMAEIAAT